ncbi:MAG: HAD-IC family P-type ATPase, partial [Longimicrobiales bacterium]
GLVQGRRVMVGSPDFLEASGLQLGSVSEALSTMTELARTPVVVAVDGTVWGAIGVSDPVRREAKGILARLRGRGIQVVMLTGDHQATAEAVAAEVGIDRFFAGILPQGKADRIAELQEEGRVALMVGDGINDGPALAVADVGIAMGGGTDVAIESGDVVLIGDSLASVETLMRLSDATHRNIAQNLVGAFFYNVLGIPIAAGVLYPALGLLLSPMLAGAAMAFSSVTVVANANRLRGFDPAVP